MSGKGKQFMEAIHSQIDRFVQAVRAEGGVRRIALEFPSNEVSAPVVVVVMRKENYEAIGEPDSTKAPHRYEKQMMVLELCSWCNQPANYPLHAATLKVLDFPNG